MPTLVLYQSNYGFAEKVANTISDALDDPSNVIKFNANKPPTLNLYDTVVIIQSIRLGQVQPELKLWVNNNVEELLSKRLVLGICCGFSENIEQYLSGYAKELTEHADFAGSFGGTLGGNYKLFDKFIVSMVAKEQAKQNKPLPVELTDTINSVITALNTDTHP